MHLLIWIIIVGVIISAWFLLKKRPIIKAQETKNIKDSMNVIKHNIDAYKSSQGTKDTNCLIPFPIYYINLDKSSERRAFMEGQLGVISSRFQRIRGVEGFRIDDLEAGTIDGLEYINKYPQMTAKEIGCSLSHIVAIKTALDAGCEIALICEDDASFDTCALTSNLTDVVSNAPSDWEMIELYTGGMEYSNTDQTALEYVLFTAASGAWSNVAYLINKKGMTKIIERVGWSVIAIAPDSDGYPKEGVADRFLPLIIKTYRTMPSIVGTNTGLGSTIHVEHVEPIHVPALYQFLKSVNQRVLSLSHQKIYVVKSWDIPWIQHVLPFPITDNVDDATIIITNANADPSFHTGKKAFSIMIDREPIDVSHWNVDLIISTKLPSSGRLPKNIPSIYLPCYSPALAEAGSSPAQLIAQKVRNDKKRKFAAFAYSNCDQSFPGVANRTKFFNLLQERSGGRVDSWGKCQRNMIREGDNGTCWDNIKALSDYKFVIAFENDYPDGYISEKLVLPMLAGAIPIYLGSSLVGEHFNPESFINVRDFDSWDACIDRILELDQNDAEYQHMLSHPWLRDNKLTTYFSWWDSMLGDFNERIMGALSRGRLSSP